MSHLILYRVVTANLTSEHVESRAFSLGDGPAHPVYYSDEQSYVRLQEIVNTALVVSGCGQIVSVQESQQYDNCECCGGYYDETWRVVDIAGTEINQFWSDGHLGGGDNLYDLDNLAIRVLEIMGHTVEIRRSGYYEIELHGYHTTYDADYVAERAALADGLEIKIRLDGRDIVSQDFMNRLLPKLGKVTRITVSSNLLLDFQEILESIAVECETSRLMVERLRSCLVVDGSLDQARRIPTNELLSYFLDDPEAHALIQASCPLSTYGDLCDVALERGISVPDDKLPYGRRREIASPVL